MVTHFRGYDTLFLWGRGDVSFLEPYWEHPIIQELRYKKQLGPLDGHNPSGNHSRFDHSGMSTMLLSYVLKVLEDKGMSPCGRKDLLAACAHHDGGHPPFSHPVEKLLEYLTGIDHKQRGLALLDSPAPDAKGKPIKTVLVESGVGFEKMKRMLGGTDPAMALCSHDTLGAEKMAYLLMDSARVHYNEQPPNPLSLSSYLCYIDDTLGVDIQHSVSDPVDPLTIVESTQTFMIKAYRGLYFAPRTAAFDRAVQCSLELALCAGVFNEAGDTSVRDAAMRIWPLADDVLVDRIRNPNGKGIIDKLLIQRAQLILNSYYYGTPFVPLVAFKYEDCLFDHLSNEHATAIEEDALQRFLARNKDPREVTKLEETLTRHFDVPVLVTFARKPEKLLPKPVAVYHNNNPIGTLEDLRPAHYANLREMARTSVAIRVHVHPDYHASLSCRPGTKIIDDCRSILFK